ncbi:hypothetical protein JD844_005441 [Phrynosoma platyrhinos]|uniref:Arginine/serine-rich protein 1 n=1 Tax=Phrynosoma platyrhinos TaxID=52577 RepID=A0ABQ7TN12_PHRPL|nr:hypothetical protein JD844_005441 [Phrynosoma platyrhinos]
MIRRPEAATTAADNALVRKRVGEKVRSSQAQRVMGNSRVVLTACAEAEKRAYNTSMEILSRMRVQQHQRKRGLVQDQGAVVVEDPPQDHLAGHLTVQDLVQALHLPQEAGVALGADQDHVRKGIVLGGTEDTQDLIPGVAQDPAATDTGKGTILDITAGDTVVLLQDTDRAAVLLGDHTIGGLTLEADQEAEDTMDLEEPYILRLIEAGEAVHDQEKRELLEIAKANAAKTFGTNIVLPASLKIAAKSNEIENGKLKDSLGIEKTLARPVALKAINVPFKETAGSPGREEKKESPTGQWIPVKNEENVLFHNFSPKSTSFRAR